MTAVPVPSDAARGSRVQQEPVRIVTALFTFVSAVITVLLASEVFSARVGAICTGILTAAYALVNELFVRSNVVPLRPLERLQQAVVEETAEVAAESAPPVSAVPDAPAEPSLADIQAAVDAQDEAPPST